MKEICLHRDDIETILQFMDAFEGSTVVRVTADNSSGIGSVIEAHIDTMVNGHSVTVTKTIVDESSW